MVESKSVVLQMIPHTLFIEWDFGHYSRHCSLVVLLFTTLFTSRFTVHDTVLLVVSLFTTRWHCSLTVVKLLFTYTVLFIYTVLFTYIVLFIRPVFFFKCSFLDLFNLKFMPKLMFSKDM